MTEFGPRGACIPATPWTHHCKENRLHKHWHWHKHNFFYFTVTCNALRSVQNGGQSRYYGPHTVNSLVTFWCNPGFQLQGRSTIICQSSGQWSAPPPTCICTGTGKVFKPLHIKNDVIDNYLSFIFRFGGSIKDLASGKLLVKVSPGGSYLYS